MSADIGLISVLTVMHDVGFVFGFTLGAAIVGIAWAVWGCDAD